MWLQILLTVLQIWCWRILSFLSQWDHTYRLPRNTSQARLGWAPSAVLQTLLNEPQTYVHQHMETTVLFNEFYGLAVGLVAGESTYHWARPLLATLWSRCRRASGLWLLVFCAPGQQGTGAYHVAGVFMATSFWPPACPFLKHKISLPMTSDNIQHSDWIYFQKTSAPNTDPCGAGKSYRMRGDDFQD